MRIRLARRRDAPALIAFNRAMALETEAKALLPEVISAGVRGLLAQPALRRAAVGREKHEEVASRPFIGPDFVAAVEAQDFRLAERPYCLGLRVAGQWFIFSRRRLHGFQLDQCVVRPGAIAEWQRIRSIEQRLAVAIAPLRLGRLTAQYPGVEPSGGQRLSSVAVMQRHAKDGLLGEEEIARLAPAAVFARGLEQSAPLAEE